VSKTKKRRHYTPEQKAAILREHLVDKTPVSELCEKHELQPSVIYQWRPQVLDGAETLLQTRRGKYRRTPIERELDAERKKVSDLLHPDFLASRGEIYAASRSSCLTVAFRLADTAAVSR